MLDWGPALRSLVAHPRLIPYLRALIGPRFRLDHSYGVFARGTTASHALHNGGSPFDPTQAYLVRDGEMHNSMVVVQFALTEVGPEDGGFCCVPGSHKANYVLPKELVDLDHLPDELSSRVRHVPMHAGDAVIFTEAVTHGALGWRGEHDRMALLYKYCHGSMQWERDSPFVSAGHSWTETQSRTLAGPYEGGRLPIE
jgi:ectoine hydroxylase-related dioxygenase (phytanoyl-CoA dioxygenase family)